MRKIVFAFVLIILSSILVSSLEPADNPCDAEYVAAGDSEVYIKEFDDTSTDIKEQVKLRTRSIVKRNTETCELKEGSVLIFNDKETMFFGEDKILFNSGDELRILGCAKEEDNCKYKLSTKIYGRKEIGFCEWNTNLVLNERGTKSFDFNVDGSGICTLEKDQDEWFTFNFVGEEEKNIVLGSSQIKIVGDTSKNIFIGKFLGNGDSRIEVEDHQSTSLNTIEIDDVLKKQKLKVVFESKPRGRDRSFYEKSLDREKIEVEGDNIKELEVGKFKLIDNINYWGLSEGEKRSVSYPIPENRFLSANILFDLDKEENVESIRIKGDKDSFMLFEVEGDNIKFENEDKEVFYVVSFKTNAEIFISMKKNEGLQFGRISTGSMRGKTVEIARIEKAPERKAETVTEPVEEEEVPEEKVEEQTPTAVECKEVKDEAEKLGINIDGKECDKLREEISNLKKKLSGEGKQIQDTKFYYDPETKRVYEKTDENQYSVVSSEGNTEKKSFPEMKEEPLRGLKKGLWGYFKDRCSGISDEQIIQLIQLTAEMNEGITDVNTIPEDNYLVPDCNLAALNEISTAKARNQISLHGLKLDIMQADSEESLTSIETQAKQAGLLSQLKSEIDIKREALKESAKELEEEQKPNEEDEEVLEQLEEEPEPTEDDANLVEEATPEEEEEVPGWVEDSLYDVSIQNLVDNPTNYKFLHSYGGRVDVECDLFVTHYPEKGSYELLFKERGQIANPLEIPPWHIIEKNLVFPSKSITTLQKVYRKNE